MWAVFWSNGVPAIIAKLRKDAINNYNRMWTKPRDEIFQEHRVLWGVYVAKCEIVEVEKKAKGLAK